MRTPTELLKRLAGEGMPPGAEFDREPYPHVAVVDASRWRPREIVAERHEFDVTDRRTGDTSRKRVHRLIVDGDDLHILMRTADAEAKNAHNSNLITFHTVRQFRELEY